MKKLVIISRDWEIYKARFEASKELQTRFLLIEAGNTCATASLKQAELMLAEPDLASECITNCSQLSWLQSTWAGNNKLQAVPKKDYKLTGVKGVFGLQMVEYVLSYLLYFTRRIEDFKALKLSKTWSQLPSQTLSNYAIGIMGLGSIGQELAQRLLQFDMTVNGMSRSHKNIHNVNDFTYEELPAFLSNCDFVINLLPETDATRGLCNRQFFEQMKKGSIFINAGRGSAIDSPQSLIVALEEEWLKAAVLDVFDQEPLPVNHAYYTTKNMYVTCHTAAISDPHQVFDLFEKNAANYDCGEALLYEHDFSRGY